MGFPFFSFKTLIKESGSSSQGKFSGYVTNDTSQSGTGIYVNTLPTTRLDGSPLQNEDSVRVHTSATLPMTIASLVFSSKKSVGYYYNGGWMVQEGIISESNEVQLKNKTAESISGTANNQSQANSEFKTEVNKKLDKATETVSIEHAYIHKANGSAGLMQINGNANASNAIVRRQPNNQLKVPETPLADDDATSKKYVDEHSVDVSHKVDRVVTEDSGAKSIIDNQKGQHGAVMQSMFGDTIVSFNTADENGEDGILAQIYAKKKSTNQGARLNIKKTGMFYGKGTSATTEADDELAVKGDVKPSTTPVSGATTMKSIKIKGVDYNLPEGGGSEPNAVHYTADTGKTDAEKQQARANIGAIADAPSDNKKYARKNGAWTEVTGGGGEVAVDNQTIFKNDEGKLHAIYGGGRVVWDTPTILELSSSMGTYDDTAFGVPIMMFGNLYSPDYWELKNRVSVSINVNGSIYTAENKVIEKITFGSLGWFKAIRLADFMEAGSESYLTYLPDYDMTIIYTSASISSSTVMIINTLNVTYDYYVYYPIEKEYMPLHPRFFSANEDGIFEPNVQIGSWAEPREILNNVGTPESYRIHEGFVYFNVDRSSEVKEGNYIEINFDITLTGLGRIRSREEGYLVKIANNQYQASLSFISGDQHTFQMIRIFANTTPAEIQLQFVNEIPVTDLEEMRDVVVRQVQYDEIDHPLPSKYLKLNSKCLKVNTDGEVFIKVSAESGNKLEIKDDGLYVGE